MTKYVSEYTYHPWQTGESITSDLMQSLEKAVESAFALLSEKASIESVNL